jgi:dTMP kinase
MLVMEIRLVEYVVATGILITLEGPDGAGKTTQANLLQRRLEMLGHTVVRTREPGGDVVGEKVRAMLLHDKMTPEAEFLLFAASRAQNVADVIEPALASGAVVLCDRFVDSSIAYQGYGRGLSVDFITAANTFATKGRMPDCTVLLDVPVEVGKARREGGGDVNRLDMEASSFHAKVRDGYLAAAAADPERIRLVDAECGVDELEQRVWDAISWLFASGN